MRQRGFEVDLGWVGMGSFVEGSDGGTKERGDDEGDEVGHGEW
jgi:hypothetical protein